MSRQEVERHIAWLGRVCEDALRSGTKCDQVGDLSGAVYFFGIAQTHAESALQWAQVVP
jgi:hypothetical protein